MNENELDRIFAGYREAMPDPEPSAQFMPRLWEAIETRRAFRTRFGRLSRMFVTAAGAVWLIMVSVLIAHSRATSPSDLDLVADAHPDLMSIDSATAGR
jgi:hypothetical protein